MRDKEKQKTSSKPVEKGLGEITYPDPNTSNSTNNSSSGKDKDKNSDKKR